MTLLLLVVARAAVAAGLVASLKPTHLPPLVGHAGGTERCTCWLASVAFGTTSSPGDSAALGVGGGVIARNALLV